MRAAPLLALAGLVSTPALAGPVKLKPLIDARLRIEGVSQAATPALRDASAITARVRAGVEASTKTWSVLVEGEGTLALDENYNSFLNGRTAFAAVADPQNIELNRAQIQYRGLPKTIVTVGRQRINLDDQRFVGAAAWRQNEQTFDAVRVEWSGVKNLKVDLTYAWRDRTIWGVDGIGARPQSIGGDNVFANVGWKHKYGLLTGFAYVVDQDDAAVQGFRLSSQTYGARYAATYPLSKAVKLAVTASYGRQSDYGRNPNRYRADYGLGELALEAKGFRLTGGYEVLGSSGGTALTSFQTPLATLHKFNGWADKFLTTPPNGLRDAYASIGYTKAKPTAFLDSIAALAAVHDFTSDRLSQGYGREVDLQLVAKRRRTTFMLKYADYSARGFAADTRKFWGSIEWAY
jgi:Alginate export